MLRANYTGWGYWDVPLGTRKPELVAPVVYSSWLMVIGAAIRFLLALSESSVKTRSTV